MKRKVFSILSIFLLPLLIFGQGLNKQKNNEWFEQIITIALKNNPAIKKALKELDAAKGEEKQAGYFPNPELDAEVENFGGDLGEGTFSSADITFYITQTIETAGKRKLRKKMSAISKNMAVQRVLAVVNSKISSLFNLYNKAAIAEQKLSLAKELADISGKILKTVKTKVKYGKTSPIQELKAQIEYDKAVLLLKQAQSEYEITKNALAFEMGVSKLPDNIEFKEFSPNILDKQENAEKKIKANPLIVEQELLRKIKEKELKLASRENIPDLNISAGIRKFKETDQKAYVLSIGFKIPVFNRNKGKIIARAAERDAAYFSKKESLLRLKTEYGNVKTELATLEKKKNVYENKIIPDAHKAYQAMFTAYREGKIGYIELLDTQRTLIEARNQYLEIKIEYTQKLFSLLEILGYFSEKLENKIKGEIL